MSSDIEVIVDAGQEASAAHHFGTGTHLLSLLDDLSDTPAVIWNVVRLELGSAVTGLVAVGETRDAGVLAARSVTRGLHLIRERGVLPPDWTPDAVGHAKDLLRSAGGSAHVSGDGVVVHLDDRLREGLRAISPWVREFYGSVRGTLTGVNVTRGNRASIRPQGGGRVVHVGFPDELAEAMRDGLLHFVEIEGKVKQNADGRTYPVSAEQVSVPPETTVTWSDLWASAPDITGGLTVAEYVEAMRGED